MTPISTPIRNVGVIFGLQLSFDKHIKSAVKTAFFFNHFKKYSLNSILPESCRLRNLCGMLITSGWVYTSAILTAALPAIFFFSYKHRLIQMSKAVISGIQRKENNCTYFEKSILPRALCKIIFHFPFCLVL